MVWDGQRMRDQVTEKPSRKPLILNCCTDQTAAAQNCSFQVEMYRYVNKRSSRSPEDSTV
ncbi:unnamed protein product [Tetraodon nigroviridis]|uniref:(spotted green pufferfish) hypothetical protein n=1 Tax=Tetraodon nigroviridis TaxID=99883 RepID=Q4SCT7_TETNG|nr:unnamed protein product [Tetraodon nigroviridis]